MRVCFTTICLTCNLFDLLSAPLNDATFIAAVQARGEDLMQIELPHHYLIDVGWYGGFSAHGTLRVVAVHQHDWEHLPILGNRSHGDANHRSGGTSGAARFLASAHSSFSGCIHPQAIRQPESEFTSFCEAKTHPQ